MSEEDGAGGGVPWPSVSGAPPLGPGWGEPGIQSGGMALRFEEGEWWLYHGTAHTEVDSKWLTLETDWQACLPEFRLIRNEKDVLKFAHQFGPLFLCPHEVQERLIWVDDGDTEAARALARQRSLHDETRFFGYRELVSYLPRNVWWTCPTCRGDSPFIAPPEPVSAWLKLVRQANAAIEIKTHLWESQGAAPVPQEHIAELLLHPSKSTAFTDPAVASRAVANLANVWTIVGRAVVEVVPAAWAEKWLPAHATGFGFQQRLAAKTTLGALGLALGAELHAPLRGRPKYTAQCSFCKNLYHPETKPRAGAETRVCEKTKCRQQSAQRRQEKSRLKRRFRG